MVQPNDPISWLARMTAMPSSKPYVSAWTQGYNAASRGQNRQSNPHTGDDEQRWYAGYDEYRARTPLEERVAKLEAIVEAMRQELPAQCP